MIRRQTLFRSEHAGRDRWMVSYTDVMTILLILFVAVAARAVQQPRTDSASSPNSLIKTKAALEARGIRPTMETRGLVISLPQTVLYRSGDDRISAEALPLVGRIAEVLRTMPNRATLVGHADPVPIHNGRFRSNWELSAARSLRLLELLTAKYGIAESRLGVSSEGSYSPRSSNNTPQGRAENRRVEIVILNETRLSKTPGAAISL